MTNFLKKLISAAAALATDATTAPLSPVAYTDDKYVLKEGGFLKAGESRTFSVYLENDESYLLVAACDGDCSDLDMFLEKDGQVIEKYIKTDARPMMILEDKPSGYYDVRIKMYSCSAEPCEFAVTAVKMQ